jgi:membrane-bound metal-dependent hydrolase YbcI (DUF457 family)
MFLWFVGMSFLAVWVVFRDPAIDHRLVIAGALLPDLLDAPTGSRGFAHALLASVLLLTAVMVATRGRRLLRRQLLALPIGTFLHLALDGVWADRDRFWWPFFGTDLARRPLPSVERGAANVLLELAGLAVLVWAWRCFRFDRATNRRRFLTTGRLPR